MSFIRVTITVLLLFIVTNNFAQTSPVPDSVANDTTIFTKVDVEAAFPGGLEAWKKFLVKNLNAQVPSENGAGNGLYRVLVQFVVSKDGQISRIKTLTNYGYGLEQEVVRTIQKIERWEPAIVNGKPVNAYRTQPVVFMVLEDGFDIHCKERYILYTGTDNELTAEIRKVKGDNITLTISQGTITSLGDGKFIAHVNEPGQALITAYNKKTNKELGSINFLVSKKE
jgi:Gram-negative bacterial TonB protein C-terminal